MLKSVGNCLLELTPCDGILPPSQLKKAGLLIEIAPEELYLIRLDVTSFEEISAWFQSLEEETKMAGAWSCSLPVLYAVRVYQTLPENFG